jgi:RNA methyltransferase, TrmH family
VATHLGARADRLTNVRALKTVKGRRQQGRFVFEGATLLEEAHRSGTPAEELYVTQAAYEASPLARELDAGGTPTYIVDERTAEKLSDVETPSGILAVAPMRLRPVGELLRSDGVLLVLGDLNDPGNAGTLLRSAEAFGASAVGFGRLGVDPYHPKVVRAAMGALFRVKLGIVEPPELAAAATAAGLTIVGLRAGSPPVGEHPWPARIALVIGHERHGLGRWENVCDRTLGIPIADLADSLNAAVAGSIALYEAAKRAI